MNQQILSKLIILGFDENIKVLPKMKEVMKRYYKLALKTHPDKPGGNKEKFQVLEEAGYPRESPTKI